MYKLLITISLLLLSTIISATEISLSYHAKTFEVPVKLNDQITLNFVVDSGAGDVFIPIDVVTTLIRTGTITKSDFLPDKQYQQADGTTTSYERIMIKQLQVGDQILYNVEAAVGKADSMMLLGQSFLQKFSSWSINNNTHTLVLGEQVINEGANVEQSPSKTTMWIQQAEGGILFVATDSLCSNAVLVNKGYQFVITASIPRSRLKSDNDAYFKDSHYATTVIGCWSPKMHKAYWHRKHDDKEWYTDFMVDNTWTKTTTD